VGKCIVNDDDLLSVVDKLIEIEQASGEDMSYWINMVYQPVGMVISIEQYVDTFHNKKDNEEGH